MEKKHVLVVGIIVVVLVGMLVITWFRPVERTLNLPPILQNEPKYDVSPNDIPMGCLDIDGVPIECKG
jgi:hypothetical protein